METPSRPREHPADIACTLQRTAFDPALQLPRENSKLTNAIELEVSESACRPSGLLPREAVKHGVAMLALFELRLQIIASDESDHRIP